MHCRNHMWWNVLGDSWQARKAQVCRRTMTCSSLTPAPNYTTQTPPTCSWWSDMNTDCSGLFQYQWTSCVVYTPPSHCGKTHCGEVFMDSTYQHLFGSLIVSLNLCTNGFVAFLKCQTPSALKDNKRQRLANRYWFGALASWPAGITKWLACVWLIPSQFDQTQSDSKLLPEDPDALLSKNN